MGYSAPVGLHRKLGCDCSQTEIVEEHPLVAHLNPLTIGVTKGLWHKWNVVRLLMMSRFVGNVEGGAKCTLGSKVGCWTYGLFSLSACVK
jgi:hypothetical protein